jgi:hypothetical protein
MSTVKEKIKGGFDLVFLFGRGIKPFQEEGTKEAALRSLWIPFFLYPIAPLMAWFYPPIGMQDGSYPYSQIFMTVTAFYILSIVVNLSLVWLFAYWLKQEDRFWLCMQASNWVSIPMTIITLPIALAMIFDWIPREEMDRISVIVTCYSFLVGACITLRSFKINWELAGFLACMSLFACQQVWNGLYKLQGIAIVW